MIARRPTRPIDRMRRVHVAATLLSGLAIPALIFGPDRLAIALLVLTVFAQLWSLEQLRAAIRNPEILK